MFNWLLWPITLPLKGLLWPAQIINTLCRFVFLLISLATVASFFGDQFWVFDVFNHFKLQFAVSLSVLALVFVLTFNWRYTLLSLAVLGLNLIALWPYLPNLGQKGTLETPPSGPTLSILHSNIWNRNLNIPAMRSLIENSQADIISLSEYGIDWQADLKDVLSAYPYEIHNDDIGLYSRFPLENAVIDPTDAAANDDTISANITFANRPIQLIVAHPIHPLEEGDYHKQRIHFERITKLVQGSSAPSIVIGDLNSTPWSSAFNRLLRQANLVDSQVTSGIQPSWPAIAIVPWISIDHILVSPELSVRERKLGPFCGSDHFPVLAKLQFHDATK